ncbi:MAG: hypothetical protein K2K57_02185 [Oscillospiraceae bacterium]|nr:hypothetical protein [Oscillospiraceae bacterium]
MEIDFDFPKWYKEKKRREEQNNSPYMLSPKDDIECLITAYKDPEEAKKKYAFPPLVDDIVSLYYLLSLNYRHLGENEWILGGSYEKCAENLYLFILAYIKAYELSGRGIEITNSSVKDLIGKKAYLGDLLYTAISLNETEMLRSLVGADGDIYSFLDDSSLCAVYSLFCGDEEKAAVYIKNMNEDSFEDEAAFKNFKGILEAVLKRDENKFNLLLAKKIKKQRKELLGYLTVADVCSAALIKTAEKYGISYGFKVIEIPEGFLTDKSFNKEKLTLPKV